MRQFYDWQTAGGGGDVSLLVATLEKLQIQWCMIGGLAVNHWAEEPMSTADVDVVIALDRVDEAVKALNEAGFVSERFNPNSETGRCSFGSAGFQTQCH